MILLSPSWLGAIYGLSELMLAQRRRSSRRDTRDRHSLLVLWLTIGAVLALAYGLAASGIGPALSCGAAAHWAGLIVFAAGLVLRVWSIIHLGRWFTVNVAVSRDQTLVGDGPYRYLRHPSYSGALLIFLGLGLTLNNAFSLAIIVLGTVSGFLWRIRVEEHALAAAFGARWTEHTAKRKRLVPGVF